MKETAIEILRDEYADVTDRIKAATRAAEREAREFRRNLIEKRTAEVKAEFAVKLREAHDSGALGVSDIQHVIGTADWNRVKKWRDLAGIPTRGEKRKERLADLKIRNTKYEWIDNVLYWYKWSNGEQMPFPAIISDYAPQTGRMELGPTLDRVIGDDWDLQREMRQVIEKSARDGLIPFRELYKFQYDNPDRADLIARQDELNAAWIGWTPEGTA